MATIKSPTEKLAELVEKAGGRPAFLARAKISKQYLSNVLGGHKGFGSAAQSRIEEALGLSPGYFRDDGAVAPIAVHAPVRTLPVYRLADAGTEAESVAVERIEVAGELGPRAFAVKMESDAMMSPSPSDISLPPGVFAVIDPDAKVNPGDMVLARVAGSGQAFVRRLIEDGPARYLAALNPKYSELTKLTGDVQLLGRVVGSVARF